MKNTAKHSSSRGTDKPVERLRYDAGSLSLDLQATLGRRLGKPVERLSSTTRLNEWLSHEGLIEQPLELTEDDVMQVRIFREALYRLTCAVLGGGDVLVEDVQLVNQIACLPTPVPQLSLDPTTAKHVTRSFSSRQTLNGALAVVAQEAIDLLTGEQVSKLRMCEANDCAMIFIDTSQGHRRQWCSNRCGNRLRVTAHRARRRTRNAV